MKARLNQIGNIAAVIGILACATAMTSRLFSPGPILSCQAINLFIVGVGFMVGACLLKIEAK